MWKTILKVLAGLATGGGLSYAGLEIYGSLVPELWKDLLTKEGYRIVPKSDTNHWKGLKKLRKDKVESKKGTYSELKSADNLDTWCEQELNKPKEKTNFKQKKEDLVALCIFNDGKPKSQREGVAMSVDKYTGWIDEETNAKTEEYERMFAVYKHKLKDGEELRLLNWLNEGEADDSKKLKDSSTNSEGGKKLEEKCKGFGKSDGQDYLWWCRKLEYKTIIEKIKKDEGDSWTPQSEGSDIKTRWDNTDEAKTKIREALGKDTSYTLQDSDYQSFCSADGSIAKKDLKEEKAYQDYYIAYKSVCSPPPS